MNSWKTYCMGLVLAAGLASAALAQLPPITPPPGVPIAPQPPPVNAPLPPAAEPPNIWDKLCPRADQCAAMRAKICNCKLGQLFNNMLAPAGAFSGGIVGPFCPQINAADLAKPADSAEGAAARLKLDEADAAARRAAIRYMAGADCHYWPEVQEALIGALRADRNECVRLEAAIALGRGCCCSRATMLALTLTVASATDDGNPPEDSERVKMAALMALNHCLANYTEVVPAPEAVPVRTEHGEPLPPPMPHIGEPVAPPRPGEPLAPPMLPGAGAKSHGPTEYYHHPENLQEKKVVEAARRAVAHVTPVAEQPASPAADHSITGIVRASWPSTSGTTTPTVEKPMVEKPTVAIAEKSSAHDAVTPAVPAPAVKPTSAEPPAVKAPSAPVSVSPASFAAPAAKLTPATAPTVAPTLAATTTKPVPVPQSAANAGVIAAAINVLHDSIYPEEREKAADALGGCDGTTNPAVVHALLDATRTDAAPVVRAASLRSLSRMNVRTAPVAAVAQTLTADPDPRVRTQAEEALKQMGATSRAQ